MFRTLAVVVMVTGCALGCDLDEDISSAEEVSLRSEVGNAQVLNSAMLNGIQFNGIQFNGIQFNGIQFNGIQFNGIQFNGIQFNGSSFTGSLDGVVKTGVDFEGAELLLAVDGVPHTLRFDDIYKDPARPNDDVYFYEVSVRKELGAWTSLCKDDAGDPVAAIPIANYWNYTTGARVDNAGVVTFACRGAALAKCIEWGYIPWHTATQCTGPSCTPVSLRDHHQACSRMVRADYCGDGRSYTLDGTPIDIYDRLQTKLQTRSTLNLSNWSPEAEWGPDGATCVGDELRLKMFDDLGLSYTFPGCLDSLDDISNCGRLPASRPGSLLGDAYCYKWTDDPEECAASHNDD